jgi:RNA polymerase sigma-70 factor (ECF subfamily)
VQISVVNLSLPENKTYGSAAMSTESDGSSTPRASFRALALAEFDSLYRLANHLCANRAQAEDLVQETYLRALKAQDQFELRDLGMRPWLFRILTNIWRNSRRTKAAMQLSGDDAAQLPAEQTVGSVAKLADLNWDMVDADLKQSIHDLPDSSRECFLLFAIEQMKYREIAEVLELPLGTVMSRLARARKQLVAALAGSKTLPRVQPRAACSTGELET